MNCTRAGCSGVIEDGYCNTCGMAPPKGGATAGEPAPRRFDAGRQRRRQARHRRAPPGAAGRLPVGGTTPLGPAPGAGPRRGRPGRLRRGRLGPVRPDAQRAHQESGPGASPGPPAPTGCRSGPGRSGRSHLGAGLVEVPPVPARDPSTAIMVNPVVAEGSRFCASCGEPVGRSRDGQPGADRGLLPEVRPRTSPFSPKLASGDLIGGQYQVVGCLAHGGLGWIYLARDRHVSDRWVVLKGLLDSGDSDAMAAAVAETPLPRRGRAPEHRQDLQLRPARRRRLHRDGVRRRVLPEGSAEGAPRGQRRQARPPARGPGHRLHPRDPARPSGTCTAAASSTATSSPTTSSSRMSS